MLHKYTWLFALNGDGQDDNDQWSRAMDVANNSTGTQIAGDGRAAAGEAADSQGFVTEQQLRQRVLDALAYGRLQVVDRSATPPAARATTTQDLHLDSSD